MAPGITPSRAWEPIQFRVNPQTPRKPLPKPFRKLHEKSLLKPQGVLERKAFTTAHAGKRPRQWLV